jgi:predicted enzyme related to lactoylglutathione lyase
MRAPNDAVRYLNPKEPLMPDPNFVILYVKSPTDSVAFYADLLGKAPVEASPSFAMFALDGGTMLGLWAAHTVEPAATAVGGTEVAFAVGDNDKVSSMHAAWSDKGLKIAQAPTGMDFGFTFVALDPDGHRLRVFAPGAA